MARKRHRHLSSIDCLQVRTTCLVCFISTVNGHCQKKKPWKTGASSGHITNLKQSIFDFWYLWVELICLEQSTLFRYLWLKSCIFLLYQNVTFRKVSLRQSMQRERVIHCEVLEFKLQCKRQQLGSSEAITTGTLVLFETTKVLKPHFTTDFFRTNLNHFFGKVWVGWMRIFHASE